MSSGRAASAHGHELGQTRPTRGVPVGRAAGPLRERGAGWGRREKRLKAVLDMDDSW
jgi:hypothetical protein